MSTTEWTGTPAEWDAELTARMNRLVEANFTAGSRSVRYIATATMPPRPVEPPSVVTASGWTVTWDGEQFKASHPTSLPYRRKWSHEIAYCVDATEAEYDAIRALRDGPAPRYEVCGWGVWKAGGADIWWSSANYGDKAEANANEDARKCGGTAHAIYRRVEGEK